ncbi:MAG: ERF family protein [Actinomycetota bacterium]|nr:ERF family protein [Actinomycetota bacterium]
MPAELEKALIQAQKAMPPVEPDATNPHFGSKFVSLGNLLSKARPVLHANGLAVLQTPVLDGDRNGLRVVVIHESGDRIEFTSPLPTVKADPQALGSAITYLRRYTLASLLGVSDQPDDDGEGAKEEDDARSAAPPKPNSTISDERASALWALYEQSGVESNKVVRWLVAHGAPDVVDKPDSLAKAISALPEDEAKLLEAKLGEKAKA